MSQCRPSVAFRGKKDERNHQTLTNSTSCFYLRTIFFGLHLLFSPVSVDEAGVDVIGSFQASDWLQADAGGLVGHDVDQPVLELVAGEVGANEAGRVGLGVGQTLEETEEKEPGII